MNKVTPCDHGPLDHVLAESCCLSEKPVSLTMIVSKWTLNILTLWTVTDGFAFDVFVHTQVLHGSGSGDGREDWSGIPGSHIWSVHTSCRPPGRQTEGRVRQQVDTFSPGQTNRTRRVNVRCLCFRLVWLTEICSCCSPSWWRHRSPTRPDSASSNIFTSHLSRWRHGVTVFYINYVWTSVENIQQLLMF